MSIAQGMTAALLKLLLLLCVYPSLAEVPQSILMVVSSHGRDGGNVQPGFEFDEFAKAYIVFRENGFGVDVASPAGGPVEADAYDPEKAYNQLVLADSAIMTQLADTAATASVDPEAYAAVFVVGGKGAMFDLPEDAQLQRFIARLYERKGIVSAVCHGPAALVNVRLSDGAFLIDGRRVNGFTNAEELAFGKQWVKTLPFMLQDRLIARGAVFESSALMLSHVAADGRLITGQNPFSTSAVAEAVVRALGREPVQRQPFRDDATIGLVARLLAGETHALMAFERSPEDYQVDLLGMYGYYHLGLASSTADIENAITMMETANAVMKHPVLSVSVIEAYRDLGRLELARDRARQLVAANPGNEKAQALLASLEAG